MMELANNSSSTAFTPSAAELEKRGFCKAPRAPVEEPRCSYALLKSYALPHIDTIICISTTFVSAARNARWGRVRAPGREHGE